MYELRCGVRDLVLCLAARLLGGPGPRRGDVLGDIGQGPRLDTGVDFEDKRRGFDLIARSLNPGGQVAFWSAVPEPDFVVALSRAGFRTRAVAAKASESSKRAQHVIYLAEVSDVAEREAQENLAEQHRAKRKNEALSYFRRKSHR